MIIQFANIGVSIGDLTVGRVVREASADSNDIHVYGHIKGFNTSLNNDFRLNVTFSNGVSRSMLPSQLYLY